MCVLVVKYSGMEARKEEQGLSLSIQTSESRSKTNYWAALFAFSSLARPVGTWTTTSKKQGLIKEIRATKRKDIDSQSDW